MSRLTESKKNCQFQGAQGDHLNCPLLVWTTQKLITTTDPSTSSRTHQPLHVTPSVSVSWQGRGQLPAINFGVHFEVQFLYADRMYCMGKCEAIFLHMQLLQYKN